MSIGSKFLSRVLNEAKSKDVDGFKDDFDITSLPSTSPAVANLTMPMARQVVQLYHLLGISLETLESRPKAVKSAAMEVADEMRTNRPLRVAAQRLFAALATAKGFARQEVKEAEAPAVDKITKKPMANDKEIDLVGSRIVRQIEEVLAALNFPSGLLTRAMRRDAASLMDTASLVQRGVVRSKFMMLADQLGIDLANVGAEVTVKEDVHTVLHHYRVKGQDLIDELSMENGAEMDMVGSDTAILTVDTISFPALHRLTSKLAKEKKITPVAGPATRDMTGKATHAGTKYLTTPKKGMKEDMDVDSEQPVAKQTGVKPSEFEVAAQRLLAALGVDVAKLPSTVKMKMAQVERGDKSVGSQSTTLRLMNTLVAKLSKQGRDL